MYKLLVWLLVPINNLLLAGIYFYNKIYFKLIIFTFSSNVGIVNVYEASKTWQFNTNNISEVKPLYTSGNLTTEISFLKFNHDSQLLSFGSNMKVFN